MNKGVPRIFHWGWGQDQRAEGQEWGWGSWGQQSPSHQLGCLGSAELPSRVRDDRPKVFHYFQHSGWPLLDTIILLVVDYHAAIEPLATPLLMMVLCVCDET